MLDNLINFFIIILGFMFLILERKMETKKMIVSYEIVMYIIRCTFEKTLC